MCNLSIAPANAIGMWRDQRAEAALACRVQVPAGAGYLRRTDRLSGPPPRANAR